MKVLGIVLLLGAAELPQEDNVRVVVWDEQQPRQKKAYENFLGNAIADHLKEQPGLTVRSVRLADPEQGLSRGTLESCDVLVWWGHVRQREVKPDTGRMLVRRVKDGRLSMVILHSAHWSTPFVEAMDERTRMDARRKYAGRDVKLRFVQPKAKYRPPKRNSPLTPRETVKKGDDGAEIVEVVLPGCCFPAYRGDGKPSFIKVLKPDHPIAAGVPKEFTIPHTEMYDEPFHVPPPDEVIFEETWEKGERFRAGAVWNLGKGKVFYFRPGHETYAVFKQEIPLKIVTNAVRWLGAERRK